MNDLGYHATLQIRGSPSTTYVPMERDPRRDSWNAGLTDGWTADYPAASNYLATLASCEPDQQTTQLSHYCDPRLDQQIADATVQQLTDPGRANNAWAATDRKVVDAAAIIPIGVSLRHDLVSRRVGNLLLHPINGPLIAQIWVQ
jgi:peptide/nickel transport system substrate-binding protein